MITVSQAALQDLRRTLLEIVESAQPAARDIGKTFAKEALDDLRKRGKELGWDEEVLRELTILVNEDSLSYSIGLPEDSALQQKAMEAEYGTDTALPKPLFRPSETRWKAELGLEP